MTAAKTKIKRKNREEEEREEGKGNQPFIKTLGKVEQLQ